jgi:hypothetical protein
MNFIPRRAAESVKRYTATPRGFYAHKVMQLGAVECGRMEVCDRPSPRAA